MGLVIEPGAEELVDDVYIIDRPEAEPGDGAALRPGEFYSKLFHLFECARRAFGIEVRLSEGGLIPHERLAVDEVGHRVEAALVAALAERRRDEIFLLETRLPEPIVQGVNRLVGGKRPEVERIVEREEVRWNARHD